MKRISVLMVVGLFLLQIACQTLAGPRPTQPSPATPAPASPPTATSPAAARPTARPTATNVPKTAPSGEVSVACVGSFGYGVTCVQNNEWVNYTKSTMALSGDLIKDISVCPGGELLILNTTSLNLFDGAVWRDYGKGWGHSSPEAVACAADNNFWVAHYQGVSHFDGATWRTYTVKESLSLNPDAYDLVEDIAIAPDGAVWVVLVNGVAVFAEDKWTVYEKGIGFGDTYFAVALRKPELAHVHAAEQRPRQL